MSEIVTRFVAAHAKATAELHQPDVFTRTAWIVCEIDEAIEKARIQAGRLRIARATHALPQMQAALLELDKLIGQAKQMTEATARVLAANGDQS